MSYRTWNDLKRALDEEPHRIEGQSGQLTSEALAPLTDQGGGFWSIVQGGHCYQVWLEEWPATVEASRWFAHRQPAEYCGNTVYGHQGEKQAGVLGGLGIAAFVAWVGGTVYALWKGYV